MTLSTARRRLLSRLADRIIAITRSHPIRVAVNGIDAAGKSYFADELADIIRQSDRQVIRASIDGFHNPQVHRYQCGVDSPQGYYYDSFDNTKFIDTLLHPLGPEGNRQYRIHVFDHRRDSPALSPIQTALQDAILIVDGIFLFRPELNKFWEYRIYLKVEYEIALDRALNREVVSVEYRSAMIDRYHRRYFAGQQIYIDECHPESIADTVIDNNNFNDPRFIFHK